MSGCEKCSLCCKLLQIDAEPEKNYPGKEWNTWCPHCVKGQLPGACGIYETRPTACSVFQCVWLQSQQRDDVPSLSEAMKPINSKVVLVQSQEDYNVLFAFVDPAWPTAYKQEPMRSHLIWVSNAGCTVVVVIGARRLIMTAGRETIELTEAQVAELAGGRYVRLHEGKVQVTAPQASQAADAGGSPPGRGRESRVGPGVRVFLLGNTAASTDHRYIPRPAHHKVR